MSTQQASPELSQLILTQHASQLESNEQIEKKQIKSSEPMENEDYDATERTLNSEEWDDDISWQNLDLATDRPDLTSFDDLGEFVL